MYAQERIAQDILKLLYNFLSKYSASLIFQQHAVLFQRDGIYKPCS